MTTSEQAEVLHALAHLVRDLEQTTVSESEAEARLCARIDKSEVNLRLFQHHINEKMSHEHE